MNITEFMEVNNKLDDLLHEMDTLKEKESELNKVVLLNDMVTDLIRMKLAIANMGYE